MIESTELGNRRLKNTRSNTAIALASPSPTPPNRHHKRDWQCSHCSQAFKKREHLERHVRSHTKERPFICPTCSKSYGRRDSLMRHERGHNRPDQRGSNSADLAGPNQHMLDSTLYTTATIDASHGQSVDLLHDAQQPESLRVTRSNKSSNSRIQPDNANRSPSSIPYNNPSQTTFTGYLAADTVDAPDLQLDWNASEDIPMMNCEPDDCDPFWFIGDSFSIDALNLSLSAAASPRPSAAPNFSSNPTSGLRTSTSIQADMPYNEAPILGNTPHRTVQSRWYTKPNANDAPTLALASLQNQDHVDDAYRTGLSSRLTIHPYDNALPSADFLNLCIRLYFSKFQPTFPILHAGSFRPSSETALVVLSICSIGSLFVGSSSAVARGRAIFTKLNKAILASWESYLHRGNRETLAVAQAATLGQTNGMLSGYPRDLVMTESFHGTIIAWARQAGMFNKGITDDALPLDIINPTQNQLDTAWRLWAEKQEKIRIVLGLHIHDSEFAAIFHHEPLLRHDPKRALLSCSDELFAATSAKQWHHLLSANSDHLCANAKSRGANLHFSLHEYAYLAGRLATIYENPSGQRDETSVAETRQLLITWNDSFPAASLKPHRDTLCLKVLWHEAFMVLYADFDLLERIVGREESSVSDKDMDRLYNWVNDADGIRCLIHATLTYKCLQGLSIGTEPAIHVPKALFYAGLVIYCHLKYRARVQSFNDVEVAELKNRDASESSGGNGISISQPDTGILYGIADLLRRQGHSGLSRRFGSILEVLIDDLSGQTPYN